MPQQAVFHKFSRFYVLKYLEIPHYGYSQYQIDYFRVNAVCPTVIETDLVRKYIEMSPDKAQGKGRNSSR